MGGVMKKVVIVGSGVIGLFCAVRLRQVGAQVTLLESEAEHPSPHGPIASAAAAGMLAALDATPSPHEALALESMDLWRFLRAGAEWADGVRFDGGIYARRTSAEAEAFIANARRLGREATPLSAAQARRRLGVESKLEHAVWAADEGTADPLRVLTGLAMQARAMGVVIEYHRDVANVTANAVLTHDDRVYEADVVLLTPGVWATQRLQNAAPALKHIRPAKGHMVAVETDAALAPNLHGNGFYLVRRREDVVLGSTMEFDRFDRKVDPRRVDELLAAALAQLPGELKPSGRAWAGVRPMISDGWPIVGWSGDVLIAAGHSRNGWLLAPVTAEIITAYVFGHDVKPEWAALSPERLGVA